MKRVVVFVLLTTAFAPISFSQAIAGIHVGDPTSALEQLHLKPLAKGNMGPMESLKFKLNSGNALSVTYDTRADRIVYLELDWDKNSGNPETDFPNFKFGSTSLEDIRTANGSNGFSYKSTAMNREAGELFTFNAYNLKEKPGLVVVFVTLVNIAELQRRRENHELGADNVAKNLKLDSLILAEQSYLDDLWGKEKIYDPQAKPISWVEKAAPQFPSPPPRG